MYPLAITIFIAACLLAFWTIAKDLKFIYIKKDSKFWHHFYTGLIIFQFVAINNNYIAIPAIIISTILIADDWYQHYRHTTNILYRSPLNKLYAYHIYPHLKKFTEKHNWFNKIFKKL